MRCRTESDWDVACVAVVHPGDLRHAGPGTVRGTRLVVAGTSQVMAPPQCKTRSLLSCEIDFGLCVHVMHACVSANWIFSIPLGCRHQREPPSSAISPAGGKIRRPSVGINTLNAWYT